MKKYRNALYATDLQFKSFSAGEQASYIANQLNTPLSLLHVVKMPQISTPLYREEVHLKLCKLKELATYCSIDNYIIEEDSSPKKSILDFINDHHIDLLFINARTHQGFDQLGSVGRFLANAAPCPIWLLPYGRDFIV